MTTSAVIYLSKFDHDVKQVLRRHDKITVQEIISDLRQLTPNYYDTRPEDIMRSIDRLKANGCLIYSTTYYFVVDEIK
jgi:hypothetical protein